MNEVILKTSSTPGAGKERNFLAQRLLRAMRQAEGGRLNYSQLAKETNVSRHKLRAIMAGKDVPLYLSELDRLDQWMTARGVDLLVKATTVFQTLSQCPRIWYYMAMYYDEVLQRSTQSCFDVQAVGEINRELALVGAGCDTVVRPVDVFAHEHRDFKPSGEGHAAVLIGSPRALDLSLVALDLLFFDGQYVPGQPVPFRFVWPDWEQVRIRRRTAAGDVDPGASERFLDNPFVVWRTEHLADRTILQSDAVRNLVAGKDAWALVYDDSAGHHEFSVVNNRQHPQIVLPVADKPDRVRWTGYGVLAGRWIGHTLYLVMAGMSGPDTQALAKCLRNMPRFVLPPPTPTEKSSVAWYVVSTTVEGPRNSGERRSDHREIVDQPQVISGPNYWPRSGGAIDR